MICGNAFSVIYKPWGIPGVILKGTNVTQQPEVFTIRTFKKNTEKNISASLKISIIVKVRDKNAAIRRLCFCFRQKLGSCRSH